MESKIFISTGDHSGDMYAAQLMVQLSKQNPGCRFFGLGGSKMEQAGFRSLIPISDISLVGFSEVLPKLGVFIRLIKRIRESIQRERPALVILIDYPGLNLRIARIAKEMGIPVLYYIPPQLWAWGKRRVRVIRRCVDRVAVIMPFELDYYRKWNIRVDYVGHPVLEALSVENRRDELLTSLGIGSDSRILGILPGVRKNEIDNLWPPFSCIAINLKRIYPDLEVLVSLPESCSVFDSSPHIFAYRGDSHNLIANSDCVITKSGTAVLEAAVLGTPMIVCYRLSWLNYFLARMFIKTRYISLVNLLMDRMVVPEFIQREVNHDNIIPLVEELLDRNNLRRRAMIEDFNEIRAKLGDHKTSEEVASIAFSMMEGS
ncbi:MAG: lipid-A-disaccharide synthase [Candidatus Glassbacteria bacterium]